MAENGGERMDVEKELSRKEERFCLEYAIDYVGAAAARRAGYAEKSAAKIACKLLKDPRVMERIRQLQKEQAERLMINSDNVYIRTIDLLDKCMANKPVLEWDYSEHCLVETGEYQVDSKGAVKCLELLAKMQGLLNKEPPMSGESGPVYYKDDLPED